MDILWIVDAQKDFIDKVGKLSVNAPAEIRNNMKKILDWAILNKIPVGFSKDWHSVSDNEISDNPDFKSTYPEHCLANSDGAELIEELKVDKLPEGSIEVKKTVFDVWDKENGAKKELETFIEKYNPDNIYVIGVATEVCVRFAVLGFLAKYKNKNVIVIEDAVYGIDSTQADKAIEEMKSKNAEFVKTKDIINN